MLHHVLKQKFTFSCPKCHNLLKISQNSHCSNCSFSSGHSNFIYNFLTVSKEINTKTQNAYSLYSLFYAPISLLAYTIVWRGNIFKHIKYYQEMTTSSEPILDIATGDGSLTKASLFQRGSKPFVLMLDISADMLVKAVKKLNNDRVGFIQGDVENLPFAENSVPRIACFGGLNSFPSTDKAFAEMARVLTKGGTIRGSALMLPKAKWKRWLISRWIQKGYQTCILTKATIHEACEKSNLKIRDVIDNGDVLLFEIEKG